MSLWEPPEERWSDYSLLTATLRQLWSPLIVVISFSTEESLARMASKVDLRSSPMVGERTARSLIPDDGARNLRVLS